MASPILQAHIRHIQHQFLDTRECGVPYVALPAGAPSLPPNARGILTLVFDNAQHARAFVHATKNIPALGDLWVTRGADMDADALDRATFGASTRCNVEEVRAVIDEFKKTDHGHEVTIANKKGELTLEMVKSLLGINLKEKEHGIDLR